MRYFLPATYSEEYRTLSLVLDAMPQGLAAREYANAIVENMRLPRTTSEHESNKRQPEMAWSTLIAHVQAYGETNGWGPDGAEKAVHLLLQMGMPVTGGWDVITRTVPNGYWTCDLQGWPFPGDQCLLAWCKSVAEHSMRKVRSKKEAHSSDPDTEMCAHLGRVLAQRPYVIDRAPAVVQRLTEYVQTIDAMAPDQFEAFALTGQGMGLAKFFDRREKQRHKPSLLSRRDLSSVLSCPKGMEWVEQGFRNFALGMGWEMRAKGNPTIFDRLNRVLNPGYQFMSKPQLEWCMDDDAWIEQGMAKVTNASKKPLVEIARCSEDQGLDMFYPTKAGYFTHRTQNEKLIQKAVAHEDTTWALALYKVALGLSMAEHFEVGTRHHQSGGYEQHIRADAFAPLLAKIDAPARDALFMEMVQTVVPLAQQERPFQKQASYKLQDPWGSYADTRYNAWTVDNHEDEYHEIGTFGYFMQWLDQWQHPFAHEMSIVGSLANDVATVGALLERSVAGLGLVAEPVDLDVQEALNDILSLDGLV